MHGETWVCYLAVDSNGDSEPNPVEDMSRLEKWDQTTKPSTNHVTSKVAFLYNISKVKKSK